MMSKVASLVFLYETTSYLSEDELEDELLLLLLESLLVFMAFDGLAFK